MRKVLLLLAVVICFVITGCDSSKINQNEINSFISKHKIGDRFGLAEIPWLSSSQSVLENQTLEIIEESPGAIKAKGDLKLPEVIEQSATYKFQDDQLLLVTYVFQTDDEQIHALMSAFGQAISEVIYEGEMYPPAFEQVPEEVNSSYMFSYDSEEDYSNLRLIVEKISAEEFAIYMDVVSPEASPANTIKPLS